MKSSSYNRRSHSELDAFVAPKTPFVDICSVEALEGGRIDPLATHWGHVGGKTGVKCVKGVREDSRDTHAHDRCTLGPYEVVQTAVLVGAVGHQGVLNRIVEGNFHDHLDPLLVNMGHNAAPKSRRSLRLLDVRDHFTRRHRQLLPVHGHGGSLEQNSAAIEWCNRHIRQRDSETSGDDAPHGILLAGFELAETSSLSLSFDFVSGPLSESDHTDRMSGITLL